MPFYTNNTVHLFVCNKYTSSTFSLLPIQSSLYLLPLASKNLHLLLFHVIYPSISQNFHQLTYSSCKWINVPAESMTLNTQPSRSLSNLSPLYWQCCATFGLGFATSFSCRHVGVPTGWYTTFLCHENSQLTTTTAVNVSISLTAYKVISCT